MVFVQAEVVVERRDYGVQVSSRSAGDPVGAGAYEDETVAPFSCIARTDVVCLVLPQCVLAPPTRWTALSSRVMIYGAAF